MGVMLSDERLAEIRAGYENCDDVEVRPSKYVADVGDLLAEVDQLRGILRRIYVRYVLAEKQGRLGEWGVPWAMYSDAREGMGG